MKFWARHISILLLVLLTVMPILFMSGLQLIQSIIKLRVDIALQESELQTITLPADQVQWYEEGREILVNGKMFDIKNYTVKENIFTAQGIFDDKETEVVRLLGHFGEKEQASYIIKLLLLTQTLFGITLLSFLLSYIKHELTKHYRVFSAYCNPTLDLQKPPPWLFHFNA